MKKAASCVKITCLVSAIILLARGTPNVPAQEPDIIITKHEPQRSEWEETFDAVDPGIACKP